MSVIEWLGSITWIFLNMTLLGPPMEVQLVSQYLLTWPYWSWGIWQENLAAKMSLKLVYMYIYTYMLPKTKYVILLLWNLWSTVISYAMNKIAIISHITMSYNKHYQKQFSRKACVFLVSYRPWLSDVVINYIEKYFLVSLNFYPFCILASTRKAMHMVRADSKQVVTISNAAGNKLHEFRVGGLFTYLLVII